MDIHEDFVQSCMDRLKAAFDTISVLERDKDSVNRVRQETTRMVRVLKVLREYVGQCDGDYGEERSILPMARYNLLLLVSLDKIKIQEIFSNFDGFKQLINMDFLCYCYLNYVVFQLTWWTCHGMNY